MPQYLLIARDSGNWSEVTGDLSPEEIQGILAKYNEWTDRIASAGKLVSGQKLRDGDGRVVKKNGGAMKVMDGPHAASKEVVGGFWIVDAQTYDEA